MTKNFLTIEEWRSAHRDSTVPAADIRASFDTEVKAGNAEKRSLTFTISTASVDRMGDSVAVDGWKLDNFHKSPVVLWQHDNSKPPIAKAPKVWIDGKKLKAEAEFVAADNPAVGRFAEGIYRLYKEGFMSATSVGFAPIKYAFVDDPARKFGIDFIEQELLEFSLVTVPANAEALIEGRSAGIDISPVLDWAEEVLSADNERIKKLADSILGADGQDERNIEWARQIAAKAGLGLYSQERIDAIERAATAQRIAKKRREIEVLRMGGTVR